MISPKSILLALALTVAAASGAVAQSLGYDDILGNWCGSRDNPNWTNYTITRSTLTVTHLPARTQTTLQIDHFEFTGRTVTIHYLSAGHGTQAGTPGSTLSRVEFHNFSGQSMIQGVSDVSGEYIFKRCDG